MSKKPWEERQQDYMNVVEAARKAGIPHPEVIAAQWALESDWGNKATGKYNYWGVKSGNGDPNNDLPGTVSWTKENINGKDVRVQQKFRDYGSLEEALADRAKFTSKKGGRYDKAGYFNATSPAEAALALQKGGYATDPNYAKSLIDTMKGIGVNPYNGQQYDYSTTQPQPTAKSAFSPETYQAFSAPNTALNIADQLANFAVPKQNNEQLNTFTQLNPLEPIKPLAPTSETISPRKKYEKQLADAFGIMPETTGGLPDFIGDLVRSVFDQTA